MKFGRKLGYHKRKVKFDIDQDRLDRAQTRPKEMFKTSYLKKFSTDFDEMWQEAWLL